MTDAAGPAVLRVGELYWKQAEDKNWILGRIVDLDEDKATFALVDEETGRALPNDAEQVPLAKDSFEPANPLFVTYPDMTSLRYLNEPALMKNLYDRWTHEDRQPYTRVSNILIAVNPLRRLEKLEKAPFVQQSLDRSPPHPYHIAENAYRQMRSVKQNQSIIISGESGSGKTETSKIILDYLTDRSGFNESDENLQGYSNQDEMSQISQFSHAINNQDDERSREHALGDRLMETIPIMESFGNATTHRNHNSSRFGKYMRLQFSRSQVSSHELHLTGASIDTYLLETSRLVQTPPGERNFHVFYELMRSGDAKYLEELKLVPNPYSVTTKKQDDMTTEDWINQYHYLQQSGCTTNNSVQDKANFQKLLDALEYVNIDSEELFRVVSGLLHLGNVTFLEEDTSEGITATVNQDNPANLGALEVAAEMLGLDSESLMDVILKKKISRMANDFASTKSNGRPGLQREASVYFVKKDLRQASYSRDTISKIIYDQVFASLMRQCADALQYNADKKDELPYIGVLDIFGFEDFEPKNRNSLEQLLINYANETLQHMFNQCILKNEFELYHVENIFAPQNSSLRFPIFKPEPNSGETIVKSKQLDVHYEDNKDCIALIAAKNEGMFSVIDTVGKLAGPSDRKLIDRFHTLFKQNSCYIPPHPKDMKHTFIIKHFAGAVRYSITSFLDKNNNISSPQFDELIQSSTLNILRLQLQKGEDFSGRRRGVVNNHKLAGSVTQIFSQQMKGLVLELESTRSNFIRCIKPNPAMDQSVFDRRTVMNQLRCSGTLQACKVLQVGLPTRVSYEELIDTYIHLLGMDFMVQFHENGRLFARALCYVLEFPPEDYRLGDTKLFFKTGKISLLDTVLNVTPKFDAEELETRLLKYVVKRRWITAVTKVVLRRTLVNIFLRVQLARKVLVLQCWFRQVLASKLVNAMRTRLRVSRTWGRLCSKLWIQSAFEGSLDDKLLFLQVLLRKKETSPDQKWLLTWLGPLERSMYVKKLGKAACVSYLAKRAFLSLLVKVRENRACVKLQSQIRRVLATKKFNDLQRQQRAIDRWHLLRNWTKGRFAFMALFRRAHLARLERDNTEFQHVIAQMKVEHSALVESLEKSNANNSSLKEIQAQNEEEIVKYKETIKRLGEHEEEVQARYQLAQELAEVEAAKASDLQDQVNYLQDTKSNLTASLNEAEAAVKQSSEREISLELSLSEKNSEISQLAHELKDLKNLFEQTVLNHRAEIAELTEKNSRLSHDNTTLKDKYVKEVFDLKAIIGEAQNEVAALKHQNGSILKELEVARVAAHQSEEVSRLQAQLKQAQKTEKDLKDKIFLLRRQNSAEKTKSAPVNMEVIELTTKLAQRESQIAKLTNQLKQTKMNLEEVQTKVSDNSTLERSLAERDTKVETLKTLLKQTQIKKEKLLHEAKSAKLLVDTAIKDVKEREDQARQELLTKIAELNEDIASLKVQAHAQSQQTQIQLQQAQPAENGLKAEHEKAVDSISRAPKSQLQDEKKSEPSQAHNGAFFETKTTASLAVVLAAVVVREFVKSRLG
ncbi:hypothetical protein LEN26_006292 [Aphanomyces euteiches]|nr:hypothetical protein LEN26_006292 [Aphanomyces euteiches]